MSTKLMIVCDGCNKESEALPNHHNIPVGWRAFTIGPQTKHACSEECGAKAAAKIVTRIFREEIPKY